MSKTFLAMSRSLAPDGYQDEKTWAVLHRLLCEISAKLESHRSEVELMNGATIVKRSRAGDFVRLAS